MASISCVSYNPGKDNSLERLIGQLGVRDHTALSPNGDKNSFEL